MSGLWNPLLSETLCKSTKWPALHYVHQNPKTGEWVASDNRVLLAELNGAIPLFEMWDADGNPVNTSLVYNDYESLIERTLEAVDKTTTPPHIKRKGLFAFIGNQAVRADNYDKVIQFIGDIDVIKFKDIYTPIYFISKDKQRRALIIPITTDNVFKAEWLLMDVNEDVVSVCDSYEEAVNTGNLLGIDYIIKMRGDKK